MARSLCFSACYLISAQGRISSESVQSFVGGDLLIAIVMLLLCGPDDGVVWHVACVVIPDKLASLLARSALLLMCSRL